MALRIDIPDAASSFRVEYSTRPSGYRTPPPPLHDVEPFTPAYPPHQLLESQWSDHKKRKFDSAQIYDTPHHAPTQRQQPRQYHNISNNVQNHTRRTSDAYQSSASPSALDVFADVATSPELAQNGFASRLNNSLTRPYPGSEAAYHSKRSRSEIINTRFAPSTASRPATSHAPANSWNQIDYRPSIDSQSSRHHQYSSNHLASAGDNVSDAELLLSFALGPTYRALPKAATYPDVSNDIDRHLPPAHYEPHQPTSSLPNAHLPRQEHRAADTFLRPSPPSKQNHYQTDATSLPYTHATEDNKQFTHHPAERHIVQPQCDAMNEDQYYPDRTFRVQPPADMLDTKPTIDDMMDRDVNHGQHIDVAQSLLGRSTDTSQDSSSMDGSRPKQKHKGWPKGKPRGKKNPDAPDTVRKKPGPKPRVPRPSTKQQPTQPSRPTKQDEPVFRPRARSVDPTPSLPLWSSIASMRRSSLPPPDTMSHSILAGHGHGNAMQGPSAVQSMPVNICPVCESPSANSGYHDQWIGCNGCKEWFHTACVGIMNERDVRDIDKFYCHSCEANGHKTSFVRKSARAHASLDYAGLNEGEVRTATDSVDHHYIRAFKDGTIALTPETFPRMRPELVTAEFFERSGTMTEPIVIPAAWNPRPRRSYATREELFAPVTCDERPDEDDYIDADFEYDCVADDGQDRLDMVMPDNLTVSTVAELVGPETPVEVIDVKSQEGGDGKWNLRKWAQYYEAAGEKPVRNVISLEVSQTKLGRLIRRPKLVRDLDLQDAVWPHDELAKGAYPQVQFYCLMSVKDCYTDFHIDFGGSSVYYHILKGSKTFFFIPPKKQHLKAYEQWCNSSNQSATFLGDITKECYRVDLFAGDTALIPSGWIHSVWTPTNSLVIGGNFLTRMHYGMQIAVNDIEKATGVGRKFRYPSFQKVLWYTVVQYLEEDPVPETVAHILQSGLPFVRQNPTWDDFDFKDPDDPAYRHDRYYSRGEIEGLVDLMRYVHRTVMISLGKIPGISKTTQEAVIRSLPKGYGDHVDMLKTFALWCSWKRGNELLDAWAYPDHPASAMEPFLADKKETSIPPSKREVPQGERRSQRAPKELPVQQTVNPDESENIPKPTANGTPKSAPGPRRIACEACRKRRIRCKHKETDEGYVATSPGQRFGIKTIRDPSPEPSYEVQTTDSPWPPVAVMIPQSADATQQNEVVDQSAQANALSSKVKACDECRKSKRRCVHDEYGNVDPVKASQTPVPRAYSANKRVRPDGDTESQSSKRAKHEDQDIFATAALALGQAQNADVLNDDTDTGSFSSNRDPQYFEQPTGIADHLLDPSLMDVDVPIDAAANQFTEASTTVSSTSGLGTSTATNTASHTNGILPEETSTKMAKEEPSEESRTETATASETAQQGATMHPGHLVDSIHHTNNSAHSIAQPARAPSPDNRSRTPSLRVQTNSSESNAETPSSPLTDLEPSSPAMAHASVEKPMDMDLEDKLQDRATIKTEQPSRVLRRRSSAFTTPKPPKRSSTRASMSQTPGATRSSKKNTGSQSSKGAKSRAFSPSGQGSPTAFLPSPTSPEEEASLKLIREMQEQDFGLRRRRAV